MRETGYWWVRLARDDEPGDWEIVEVVDIDVGEQGVVLLGTDGVRPLAEYRPHSWVSRIHQPDAEFQPGTVIDVWLRLDGTSTNGKILAIKTLRNLTGWGLRQAKDFMDDVFMNGNHRSVSFTEPKLFAVEGFVGDSGGKQSFRGWRKAFQAAGLKVDLEGKRVGPIANPGSNVDATSGEVDDMRGLFK